MSARKIATMVLLASACSGVSQRPSGVDASKCPSTFSVKTTKPHSDPRKLVLAVRAKAPGVLSAAIVNGSNEPYWVSTGAVASCTLLMPSVCLRLESPSGESVCHRCKECGGVSAATADKGYAVLAPGGEIPLLEIRLDDCCKISACGRYTASLRYQDDFGVIRHPPPGVGLIGTVESDVLEIETP